MKRRLFIEGSSVEILIAAPWVTDRRTDSLVSHMGDYFRICEFGGFEVEVMTASYAQVLGLGSKLLGMW